MKARRKLRSQSPGDLYAELHQSVADKLLNSINYPFQVVENRRDFPGCSRLALAPDGFYYVYSKSEIRKMLSQSGRSRGRTPIDDQIFSFGGSIIEQAKKVLDAANSGDSRYDGPTKKELQKIIDGGTPGLVDTLSDFGLYAWCPYLRVILRSRPSLRLSSPRIDLNDIRIEVTATGELWAKYPWFNCYKWCLEWKKVIKCDKIASITVSPNMKAEAHADCSAQGTKVFVRALFDKLRLDYDILNKIPLEGIANDKLKDQLVFVYDASQLVQTVPILKSRFAVSSISLPPSASGINVAATISRI